jgi:MoaA/NifB/PqqE/SkfB family radical SAM enzyme
VYAIDDYVRDDALLDGLERSLLSGTAPPVLREAKIKITSFCNLRCQMCHYWETKHEDALTTEQWKGVLTEIAALGCRKVHFSGGEVFLRRDFLDLVDHTVAAGMKANMTTNATLIDKVRAKRMARAGINSVSISFDGPSARVHDGIRGIPGSFRRSQRAMRWLKRFSESERRPIKLRMNFVVMNHNFRTLPQMVELAGELGAIELNPMPVDEKGPRKNRLSRRQIEEYNREIAPRVLELRERYGLSTARDKVYPFGVTPEEVRLSREGQYARGFYERQPCLAPWLHTFLAWNGDVFLCCMTNGRIDPLGNAGRQTMREIFHAKPYRKVRAAFLAGRHFSACKRCDLFLAENSKLHEALGAAGAFRGQRASTASAEAARKHAV